MTEKAQKYLSDILSAIELVESFTRQISSYDDYISDLKTQSAVERQLGIIGEAVNKFNSLGMSQSIQNASKIVSVRNRIIHAYDAIDNSIIWTIVKRYLPGLKEEADYLQKQYSE